MSQALLTLTILGSVLRVFASQPWVGSWEATSRKENFPALIAALGAPPGIIGGDEPGYLSFSKTGDTYRHIMHVPGNSFLFVQNFKLGEEGTRTRNQTELKFKYAEQGDELIKEHSMFQKRVQDTFHVEGEELVAIKTYPAGNITAKRWFKKFPGEVPVL